jgi:nitrosocyanin
MKKYTFASLLFILAGSTSAFAAETRTFNIDAVELSGAKFWLPSEVVVKKGDTVKIHLTSKVAAPGNVHGFAIDAYKIEEVVDEKGKDISFVADKAGIFPIRCQLHPAHIGGQLVVLE